MRLGLARVCVAAVVALWVADTRAETPDGAYTIALDGDAALVVPTGDGEVCEADGSGGEVCVSTHVSTSVGGVVSGSGLVTDTLLEISVDLDLVGQVSGSTTKPKLVLGLIAAGSAGGLDVGGKGKIKCAPADGGGTVFDCQGKAKLCAFELGHKLGCEKVPFATQVAYARQPFELDLDLLTVLQSTVTGDATAQIGALTVASYAIKGKYKPSADASTLVLKCTDDALKSKVALNKVVLAAGAPTAGTAVFKLMGQKGAVTLPSVP